MDQICQLEMGRTLGLLIRERDMQPWAGLMGVGMDVSHYMNAYFMAAPSWDECGPSSTTWDGRGRCYNWIALL